MAAISKIRKHSVLLMVFIGGALIAFVLSDLGKGTRRDSKYFNVGEVDGKKISTIDFNNEVDEITNIRSMSTDSKTLSEMSYQIRESVWNDMIKQTLLQREYDKVGVKVTSEELNDLIRGTEPHQYIKSFPYFTDQATGEVDYEYINMFLENLNNSQVVPTALRDYYLYLESMVKSESEESRYNDLIAKGYYVPTAFAEKEYKEKNTDYDVTFVAKKYKDYPDSLFNVTDAEISSYYKSHKENYKVNETRNIAYVELDIKPTVKDRQDLDKEVEQLYKEFKETDNVTAFLAAESDIAVDTTWKGENDLSVSLSSTVFDKKNNAGTFITPYNDADVLYFAKVLKKENRPDSLKASHILISYAGAFNAESTVTRSKESAKNTADSIAQVLKKNSKAFEDLAKQHSNDPSAQTNNGSLGWFTDGTMVYPFNEFVVNSKKGTIDVVETVFGYHIIKVEDKTEPKPKAQVAIFARNIVPSNQTYQDSYMEFSAFAAQCKNYDELLVSASDKGYNIKYYDNATRMSQGLTGIQNSREVIRWAFDEETELNQVSSVYDLSDKLIVASVTEISPDGYLSVEQVAQRIKPLLIKEKKAEKAKADLNAMLQGCSSVNQLASKMNVTTDSVIVNCNISNITRYGSEPKVIGTMFAAPENAMQGPVCGEQAAYVFVKKLKETPEAKSDYRSEAEKQESIIANRITRMAVKTMQDNAEIEDNRFLFY